MIKFIIKLFALSIFSCGILAQEITLTGPDVVYFDYPVNFKEQARFIKQGRETDSGLCEFITTLRAKPGESIIQHELAYSPKKCQSLVVQGIRVNEDKKKEQAVQTNSEENTLPIYESATSSSASVYASLRTWYDDPIYIDVNAVVSEIWWDPISGCASGNYFDSKPSFEWLSLSGWEKRKSSSTPLAACTSVSLDATATYKNSSFPTCNKPVTIFYNANTVFGYDDSTGSSTVATRKVGPKFLCTNWLSEHQELVVKQLGAIVDGEIGCLGREAALFINGLLLKQGEFDIAANGNDYDGDPIYFNVTGTLIEDTLDMSIAMYSDAAHSTHIRTDHCNGAWDGSYFYDGSCELTQDTIAGCVPIWVSLNKDDGTASALFYNSTESFLPGTVDDTQLLRRK